MRSGWSAGAPPEHLVLQRCSSSALLAIGFQCKIKCGARWTGAPPEHPEHIIVPTLWSWKQGKTHFQLHIYLILFVCSTGSTSNQLNLCNKTTFINVHILWWPGDHISYGGLMAVQSTIHQTVVIFCDVAPSILHDEHTKAASPRSTKRSSD